MNSQPRFVICPFALAAAIPNEFFNFLLCKLDVSRHTVYLGFLIEVLYDKMIQNKAPSITWCLTYKSGDR